MPNADEDEEIGLARELDGNMFGAICGCACDCCMVLDELFVKPE